MANYRIIVSYDGTNYFGFQRQSKLPSIQKEIEKALTKISGIDIKISGASRTDKAVHALYQVASFRGDFHPRIDFKSLLNSFLPEDIRVLEVKVVDELFHPRIGVKQKHYRYQIEVPPHSVVNRNYYEQLKYDFSLEKLSEGLKVFVGTHNFRNYQIGFAKENTIRTIFDIKISKIDNHYFIDLYGDGFLRGQIRLMVGIALKYANNKIELDEIKESLTNDKKVIYKSGGRGLYLMNIEYLD